MMRPEHTCQVFFQFRGLTECDISEITRCLRFIMCGQVQKTICNLVLYKGTTGNYGPSALIPNIKIKLADKKRKFNLNFGRD